MPVAERSRAHSHCAIPLALHVLRLNVAPRPRRRPARTRRAAALSLAREQLSIKTNERDGRSPLPLAGRPVRAARQFCSKPRPLQSFAASARTNFTTAHGSSFVPIFEDRAPVLCFSARPATSPGLLRSRTARSVWNRVEIRSALPSFVTVTPRNAFAGRFEQCCRDFCGTE